MIFAGLALLDSYGASLAFFDTEQNRRLSAAWKAALAKSAPAGVRRRHDRRHLLTVVVVG